MTGVIRFRHRDKSEDCKLGCSRDPIKTQETYRRQRQRHRSDGPRGLRNGWGRPRKRSVPKNVVTPVVWGGSTGLVGPGIGKIGSKLPEHIGESFIDVLEVEKLKTSL